MSFQGDCSQLVELLHAASASLAIRSILEFATVTEALSSSIRVVSFSSLSAKDSFLALSSDARCCNWSHSVTPGPGGAGGGGFAACAAAAASLGATTGTGGGGGGPGGAGGGGFAACAAAAAAAATWTASTGTAATVGTAATASGRRRSCAFHFWCGAQFTWPSVAIFWQTMHFQSPDGMSQR